jgi:cadmium resistance protein CadD (predicted permease)
VSESDFFDGKRKIVREVRTECSVALLTSERGNINQICLRWVPYVAGLNCTDFRLFNTIFCLPVALLCLLDDVGALIAEVLIERIAISRTLEMNPYALRAGGLLFIALNIVVRTE